MGRYQVSISMVMLALLLNLFLIPAVPVHSGFKFVEMEKCGVCPLKKWSRWSLFILELSCLVFEYIGEYSAALFIRRFSTKQRLTVLVILAAIIRTDWLHLLYAIFSGYGHYGCRLVIAGHLGYNRSREFCVCWRISFCLFAFFFRRVVDVAYFKPA